MNSQLLHLYLLAVGMKSRESMAAWVEGDAQVLSETEETETFDSKTFPMDESVVG
jgi:hypothetical protein